MPQDFLLIAIGSHGDVHPFIGIGRGLAQRGHRVRLAANEIFGKTVENAGLTHIPLGNASDYRQVQANPDVWHHQRGPGVIMQMVGQTLRNVYDLVAQNAEPDTFVVGSSLAMGALCASEKLKIRMATAHLAPICIRSSVTLPVLPGGINLRFLPLLLRQKFWSVADRWFIDPMLCPALNAFRAEVGLAPVTRWQNGFWHAPLLTLGLWPEWFFPRQSDYPQQVRLAGFPLYDESDHVELDADLLRWLDAGEAPIAFTPGSAMLFGRRFFESAIDACTRLNRRGILLTRHPEQLPDPLPDHIRYQPFAPFGLLLPRCCAAVHHGGIGSTAQALRAGVPQLIMPMSHDQFDNAAICKRLGVADFVSARKFTGKRVATKLKHLIDDAGVPAACQSIAAKSRAEDGVAKACELLIHAAADDTPVGSP